MVVRKEISRVLVVKLDEILIKLYFDFVIGN